MPCASVTHVTPLITHVPANCGAEKLLEEPPSPSPSPSPSPLSCSRRKEKIARQLLSKHVVAQPSCAGNAHEPPGVPPSDTWTGCHGVSQRSAWPGASPPPPPPPPRTRDISSPAGVSVTHTHATRAAPPAPV